MANKLDFEGLERNLASNPVLRAVNLSPVGPQCAVVGGFVRDMLLGREHPDVDLSVADEPMKVANQLRTVLGGGCFTLDPTRGTIRCTSRSGIVVDVARRIGKTWEEDLGQRDLTINALGVVLGPQRPTDIAKRILDPTGGLGDLAARQVRTPAQHCMAADPVRILRVFRFAAQLGFEVDPQTAKWVGLMAGSLQEVAAERVRDELFKLLNVSECAPYVGAAANIGILEAIVPELGELRGMASTGHFDAFVHRIESLRALDGVLADPSRWTKGQQKLLCGYLEGSLAGSRSQLALLRAGLLFGDLLLNAPLTRRLRLSVRESRWLRSAFGSLEVIRDQVEAAGLGPTALLRAVRAGREATLAAALMALADNLASRDLTVPGDSRFEAALRVVYSEAIAPGITARVPPLLRGDDLISEFGIGPGPQIREHLEAIDEARVEGLISSAQEALDLVRRRVKSGLGASLKAGQG